MVAGLCLRAADACWEAMIELAEQIWDACRQGFHWEFGISTSFSPGVSTLLSDMFARRAESKG